MSLDSLELQYRAACERRSDIYEHLPTFVEWCKRLDVSAVLELGVRGGESTAAWLYGTDLVGGRLWSVDLDPQPQIVGAPHWTFVQGDDTDPWVRAQLPMIVDVVFIDTSHAYAHTLVELALYEPMVRSGGVMLLHDVALHYTSEAPPGVEPEPVEWPVWKAVEHYCALRHLSYTMVDNCYGLATIHVP